jgi:hypothetical protein
MESEEAQIAQTNRPMLQNFDGIESRDDETEESQKIGSDDKNYIPSITFRNNNNPNEAFVSGENSLHNHHHAEGILDHEVEVDQIMLDKLNNKNLRGKL